MCAPNNFFSERWETMASASRAFDLKLSGGQCVKAHVCDESGHVLMVPLCYAMERGRDRDPWKNGRNILIQLAKEIESSAAATEPRRTPSVIELSRGRRAMHRTIVQTFLKEAYGEDVDADQLRAMEDACKEREESYVQRVGEAKSLNSKQRAERDGPSTSKGPQTKGEAGDSCGNGPHEGSCGSATGDESDPSQGNRPKESFADPPLVTEFAGVQFVDATKEWHKLPHGLRELRSCWHTRLASVGISIAACRLTKIGDITTLVETRVGGTKSVYVPLSMWNSMLERVRSGHGGAQKPTKQTPIQRTVDHELADIQLQPGEEFQYEGVVLNIKMYGERTVGDMYADLSNTTKVLGIHQVRDCPDVEVFDAKTVDGREIPVINFRGLVTLWAVYARKSVIASALLDWVVDTVFSAQYGGQAPVQQGEYAAMTLVDRSTRYSGNDWAMNGDTKVQGLYLDEVCSATMAHERWPEQVGEAMQALPDGTSLHDAVIVKIGYSIDKKRRACDLRTDMRKAFGPEADLRIVAFARCPDASEQELKEHETDILMDFKTYQLRGVVVDGVQPQELFVATRTIARDMASALSVQASVYVRSRVDRVNNLHAQAETRAAEAEERVRKTRESLERMNLKMEALDTLTNERMAVRDSKIQEREATIEANKLALASKDEEIKALRKALTKTLPSEVASLLAGVLA